MAQPLAIEQFSRGANAVIKLTGSIDEHSDFSSVTLADINSLTVDFSGVTLINSLGIQKWITFLDSVSSHVRLTFSKCPLRVVNQINLFPDFTGKRRVEIESFCAPYYCDKCDESFTILLATAEHFPTRPVTTAPQRTCPSCNAGLQFDGIDAKFFRFLK